MLVSSNRAALCGTRRREGSRDCPSTLRAPAPRAAVRTDRRGFATDSDEPISCADRRRDRRPRSLLEQHREPARDLLDELGLPRQLLAEDLDQAEITPRKRNSIRPGIR